MTESWNGTSWSEVNDLNKGRITGSQFGTSSDAGLYVGGGPSSPSYRAYTETWNGTSWTETTDLSTGKAAMGGSGSTTSGLIFGKGPPFTGATEFWDGSSVTEIGD